ncbi:Inner membrane protein YhaH [Roseivivax sp. THAF40]|uniref:DUF805 domain-containing protein n=1 Tax=unclassified Roseivivax TaxID=2639302 RepID=UPI001267F059|nr:MULTISPECIES: DUF805 domain-containing protein [unclassified Roseivivax]QFS82746.1 Inner membrane protein YhaH [Roseivivax sp. THAF197b]QFT46515.1 Inner membrane protein YhaH [Roseivivax sp. THAF40]
MTFTEAIKTCFSKYATFQGRAARPEFWYFALFLVLGNFLCGLIDRALFGTSAAGQPVSILGALFSLAVFLPWIAVGVRRLHDVNKSGWWYLLVLIPVIGALVLLYFFVQRGAGGANDYGPRDRQPV